MNWIELVAGVIVPGIVLGPFFILAAVIGPMTLATVERARIGLASSLSLILLAVLGVLAITSLASVIVFSPEQVRARPVWRWGAVVMGVVMVPAAIWVIVAASGPPGPMMLINSMLFGGPIVVGVRYTHALLLPATCPSVAVAMIL